VKVEIFNLCDYATGDISGKMTLVGVFDSVYSRELPVVIMFCSVAIRVRFDKAEEGSKRLRATIIDSDGIVIVPATETPVQVFVPPEWQTSITQIVAVIPQLQLPHFGEYSLELEIDGQLQASTPLYAREIPMVSPHFQTPQRPARF